ncbi:hypothetical protein GCM10022244_18380 [Streptomyces gulbargensis]|uniref:Uncharacterized protein n=1 Tax=Streptomyces gulbargensis TaxID=364901 RepID=A0ABP7LWB1_9ACTN
MEDIDVIAALQDPVRRLYAYVAVQGREVGRIEAAGTPRCPGPPRSGPRPYRRFTPYRRFRPR